MITIVTSYTSFDEGTKSYGGRYRSSYNHGLRTIEWFDDFAWSQRTSWQTWFGQNCWKLCFW